MSVDRSPDPASAPAPVRAASPGRPKDLSKRATILDAAKRMFIVQGYEGVSMDQIAAEAGVSKLTVYSHFGDKEALFVEAVKARCERQLPASVFETEPATPVRERLLTIARTFFAMVSTPESIAGHRVMCTPHLVGSKIPSLFWEAGPRRIQKDFADLLTRRAASGELAIRDAQIASSQFFTLVKGELHTLMVLGCATYTPKSVESHLQASVDLFLRAYGSAATVAAIPRGKARGG
ncbi:MAG: TetR/AcrR family transcriptional regulator [Luteimonas sp.]